MFGSSGEDVNISDYLTSFLKAFKNHFHCQLVLMQSVSLGEVNLDDKAQKVNSNMKQINEQMSSLEITNSKINWRTIQRFCLRINQYLEYRVNKLKGIVEVGIFNQVEGMSLALNKIFIHILEGKGNQQNFSVLAFLKKICLVQFQFMLNAFQKFASSITNNKANEVVKEIIDNKQKYKIPVPSQLEYKKSVTSQHSLNPIKRINLFRRKTSEQNWTCKLKSRKSNIERKSQRIDDSSNNSICLGLNVEKYKSGYLVSQRNPEDSDLNELKKKNVTIFKSLGLKNLKRANDLLEIDLTNVQKQNDEENLLRELFESNKRNSLIIQKYRKRAFKKKNILMREKEIENCSGNQSFFQHKRSATFQEDIGMFSEIKTPSKVLTLPLVHTRKIKV